MGETAETDAGDEAKKGGADVVKAFIGVERAGYTRVEGFLGEKVAYYIGAAGGSGIDRLEKGSMMWEEKLMFYSDYCSSGSTIGTLTKRFDDLAPHYAPGGRYAEVEARAQRRWGMSERQKLELLLIPIERQLAAIMDISDLVNLPLEVSKI